MASQGLRAERLGMTSSSRVPFISLRFGQFWLLLPLAPLFGL